VLDWTSSLYVALYFAVEENHDEPGDIWFFNWTAFQEQGESYVDPRQKGVAEKAIAEGSENKLSSALLLKPTSRMIAQQSQLTFCTSIFGNHKDILEKVAPAIQLTRVHIDSGITKRKCMMQLQRMNITASALFPGLDGLGRSIAEYVGVELCKKDLIAQYAPTQTTQEDPYRSRLPERPIQTGAQTFETPEPT